jgi:hypothetical protein
MSSQLNCAIVEPKANWYVPAMPVVTAKLHLSGQEAGRDLGRWSG